MSLKEEFNQWIRDYERMIRHMIVGFEAKPALQDELFQDIALNLWKAIPSFKGEASAKTFVARVAQNVLANHVAKSVRTLKPIQEDEKTPELACTNTPYHSLDKVQRQKRLSAAIQKLGFEQQQVITLALEGMSYQDMADILKISSNLVGVRLKRAKTMLAELLEVK